MNGLKMMYHKHVAPTIILKAPSKFMQHSNNICLLMNGKKSIQKNLHLYSNGLTSEQNHTHDFFREIEDNVFILFRHYYQTDSVEN